MSRKTVKCASCGVSMHAADVEVFVSKIIATGERICQDCWRLEARDPPTARRRRDELGNGPHDPHDPEVVRPEPEPEPEPDATEAIDATEEPDVDVGTGDEPDVDVGMFEVVYVDEAEPEHESDPEPEPEDRGTST